MCMLNIVPTNMNSKIHYSFPYEIYELDPEINTALTNKFKGKQLMLSVNYLGFNKYVNTE